MEREEDVGGSKRVKALRYPPVILMPKPVADKIVRKTVWLALGGARNR
jgi:hypothetical protein